MSYEQQAFEPTGKIIRGERVIEVMEGDNGELYTREEWGCRRARRLGIGRGRRTDISGELCGRRICAGCGCGVMEVH